MRLLVRLQTSPERLQGLQEQKSSVCSSRKETAPLRNRGFQILPPWPSPAGTGPVTLDCGKALVDPDGEPGAFAFDWLCVGPNPDGCFTGAGAPLAFLANSSKQVFTLQASPQGIAYNFSVRVTKGASSASATGFLVARSLPLPTVSVSGLPDAKVNPLSRLVLEGSVTSVAPETLQVRWAQMAGPPIDLSDPAVRALAPRYASVAIIRVFRTNQLRCCISRMQRQSAAYPRITHVWLLRAQVAATPVTSPSLVLKPGALAPGETYRFNLTAVDAGGTASAEVTVPTAGAPRGLSGPGSLGNFIAVATTTAGSGGDGVPSPAVAFATTFMLSASGWLDEDGPLLYQAQYIVEGQATSSAGDAAVVLARFQPGNRIAGVTLPAGLDANDNRVVLQLCARLIARSPLHGGGA